MAEDLASFVPKFARRVKMYTLTGTFAEVCAFLQGYVAGSDSCVLDDFRAWLRQRTGGRPELAFPAMVLRAAFTEKPMTPKLQELSPIEDEHAVAVLFELLEDFLSTRSHASN